MKFIALLLAMLLPSCSTMAHPGEKASKPGPTIEELIGVLEAPAPGPTPTATPAQALRPRHLPNDCALTATEAYVRLKPLGVWVQMVHLGIFAPSIGMVGHAVVCWQLHPGGAVLMYDETFFDGTIALPTTSQDPQKIRQALQTGAPEGLVVFELSFYL